MNAVSHGLTSTRVMPDEVQMVQEFTHELTEYYKPESPLEVLQIQRIAFCRAKLAKLIDIELAGREIARRDIEHAPERVMQRLSQYSSWHRDLASGLIRGESPLARFGLNIQLLDQLSEEIKAYSGLLRSEDDLCEAYPKLCKFLQTVHLADGQASDMGVDQRLSQFSETIRNWESNKRAVDPRAEATVVDKSLLAIKRDADLADRAQRIRARQNMSGEAGYHQSVEMDLSAITGLAATMHEVGRVVSSFEEMKSWMLRSVDMNAEDSERMMKYQTMLERRLSTAIGELLELRKHR